MILLKKEHIPQEADLVAADEALKLQEYHDATLQSAAEKSKSAQKIQPFLFLSHSKYFVPRG